MLRVSGEKRKHLMYNLQINYNQYSGLIHSDKKLSYDKQLLVIKFNALPFMFPMIFL